MKTLLKMLIPAVVLLALPSRLLAGQKAQSFVAPGANYTETITPGVPKLPFVMDHGVKVFHLIAEPVRHEIAPGMVIQGWGYNGSIPGPTIEAVEGDRVRILVTNKLPEQTSIHWHGVILPSGMDGVGGVSQHHIQPGETYAYEFTLKQHGTQMYHPHADETTQMALGQMGFFIIHPKREPRRIDKDFAIFLQEWDVPPGSYAPNPVTMTDFNLFTFNGRAYPGTVPLIVQRGDRVRIRYANLTMDSHPIHIHGYDFVTTGTDGGPIQPAAWVPETTVNVPPGTTRDIEFTAVHDGDWALHCHKAHHAMNQMNHAVPNLTNVDQDGLAEKIQAQLPGYMPMGQNGMSDMAGMDMGGPPNTLPMMTGDGPKGPIEMGGMFTVVKVRDRIHGQEDPGWYQDPPGTLAHPVDLSKQVFVDLPEGAPAPAPKPAKPPMKMDDMKDMDMKGMDMNDMDMKDMKDMKHEKPGRKP